MRGLVKVDKWLKKTHNACGHRRGAPLFLEIIRQISMSHGTKIANLDSILVFKIIRPVVDIKPFIFAMFLTCSIYFLAHSISIATTSVPSRDCGVFCE